MTTSIDLQAIRLRTVAKAPYLASALWSVVLVESDKVPSMGVDKHWRLYINPEGIKDWTPDEQVGVLVHEVGGHLIRGHWSRGENLGIRPPDFGLPSVEMAYKAFVWNVATDCSINDDIQTEFSLPDSVVLPEMYKLPKGKIAEYYYDELLKNKQLKDIFKAGVVLLGPMNGNDGSGAGNMPGEWEVGVGADAVDKNGNPVGDGVSPGEGELIKRQVAQDIQEHKKRGTVPGFLDRWADEILRSKVDWRTKLSAAIRGQIANVSGLTDYTYRRPSRRQSSFPRVVLPSLRGTLPKVSIAVDTSGSMGAKDLSRAAGEIAGVLSAINCEIEIFAGDTQVYEKQTIKDVRKMKLTGGGGTDMRVLIDTMDKAKCGFAILITDLETPWPETRPKHIRRLIIVGTRSGSENEVPNWAKKDLIMVEE